MNSAKKRAIILMVSGAVIGVLAVGVYFVQDDTTPPTTNIPTTATSTPSIFDMEPIIPEAKVSTEGWKTCRNEEYGYEFQFPGEWHIYGNDALTSPDSQGKTYLIYEHTSEECNGAWVLLSPEVIVEIPRYIEPTRSVHVNRPESQYLYKDIHSLAEEMVRRGVEQQYILLDGRDGLLRVSENYGKTSWSVTSWFRGGVYMLIFPQYDNDIEIAETVFSTFRFLDTASSTTATSPAV